MIGLILAAGKGSRLGSQTANTPKSLLSLTENKTLLDYNIDILEKLGITDIRIVTGFQADKIEDYTKNNEKISYIYNPFWDKCNVLGSLYMALPSIDDDFFFLHADTLVDISVWEKLKDFQGDMVLPYVKKKCGEEEMKVRLDVNGNLLEITKEMDASIADGEFLGIAKFLKGAVPYMIHSAQTLFKTGNLNFYMEAVVQKAIDESKDVKSFDIGDAKFIEVDFEEDYQNARRIFG
ncbi:NTP transferase domain-containing protein [Emticicia sp. SJ17W-69]|uniref:phosphocholine cytidylyltransferase family protein n=1 Tax=Emticicia sp. SJ17W-69 TaxID=3421657 RepID=UPI003EB93000